ncbi:helix-turn-helix domain-containing protein [Nonomuraea phyllanthi]|uniref:Helix-turn-helix domain-containing protein n=2 Tax=Nonomuraea phyllanthi TaxID=2219224 RepID=A0A5C4WT39_9ACTN|nr:helix-turn-helix domain-containing protein [Nonomuraea phyllanthi]
MRDGGLEAIFGVRVRELRQARGWSQEELADRLTQQAGLQFHQTQIGKVESGTRPIRLNEAAALALIFNVPLQDLIGSSVAVASPDPLRDQLVEQSLKIRALQDQQKNAELTVDRAMRALAHNRQQVVDAQSRMADLYRKPLAAVDPDAAARKRGQFSVQRHSEGKFSFFLTIDSEMLLVGGSKYSDVASVLLDIAFIRYLSCKGEDRRDDRIGWFGVMQSSQSNGHALVVLGNSGQTVATGPYADRDKVMKDIELLKALAPHVPTHIRQVSGSHDPQWFSVAAYVPENAEYTYEFREVNSRQYEYVRRWKNDERGGVGLAAGGFHTRHQALRQIQKDQEKFPGPVLEISGSDRSILILEAELKNSFEYGYISSPSSSEKPVEIF